MITFSTLCPLWCFFFNFFLVILALSCCAHMCFRVVLKRNECNQRSTSRETMRAFADLQLHYGSTFTEKEAKMRQSTRSGEARTYVGFFQCLSPFAPPPLATPPPPPPTPAPVVPDHIHEAPLPSHRHPPDRLNHNPQHVVAARKLAWEMRASGTISFRFSCQTQRFVIYVLFWRSEEGRNRLRDPFIYLRPAHHTRACSTFLEATI